MNDARLHIRVDDEMKEKLEESAKELGITTASLVRACVKDMLRNGGGYFMLPENLRPTIIQEEESRKRTQAYIKEELRQRRHRQTMKYMREHPLPRRIF